MAVAVGTAVLVTFGKIGIPTRAIDPPLASAQTAGPGATYVVGSEPL